MAQGGGIRQQISVDGKEQVVAAFKEVGAAGEQAFGQVDKGSKTATQSLRGFTREATGMRRATGQLLKNFSDMGRGLESIGGLLGSTFGGVVGGVIGVGLGRAIGGIVNSLGEVSERLAKIQQQAQEIGAKPLQVQAAQEIGPQIGLPAGAADKALAHLAGLTEKVAAAPEGLAAATNKAVTVLRGSIGATTDAIKVLRGSTEDAGKAAEETSGRLIMLGRNADGTARIISDSTKKVADFSDPLKALNANIGRIRDSSDNFLVKQKKIAQAFLDTIAPLDKTSQRVNALSKAVLDLPAGQGIKFAQSLVAGDLDKKITELEASARGATDPLVEMANRRRDAIALRNQMFTEFTAGIVNWYIALDAAVTDAENKFIKETLPKWSADFSAFFNDSFMPVMQSAWASFLGDMSQLFVAANWSQLWTDFANAAITSLNGIGKWWGDLIKGMVDSLANLASAAGQKLSDLAGAAGRILSSMPAAPGLAAGGMVHGPGSGTSDSIMARLSNGEFVMRAAAVQHWGAGLLASMNAAVGGLSAPLVPRRPGRFAEGGLVMAGAGGTPVHLHLGGSSFALSGSESIVSSLVTEARRQHMRSAGIKPSWYGGR